MRSTFYSIASTQKFNVEQKHDKIVKYSSYLITFSNMKWVISIKYDVAMNKNDLISFYNEWIKTSMTRDESGFIFSTRKKPESPKGDETADSYPHFIVEVFYRYFFSIRIIDLWGNESGVNLPCILFNTLRC